MSSTSMPRLVQALGAVAALSAVVVPAWAQPSPARPEQGQQGADGERGAVLDTIVVTGERVERSLRNTASSVTPLTGEELDTRVDKASVAQVIADVPNVLYPDTVSAPIIRGQDTQGPNFGASAFLGGTVPRATVNVDGRYLSYNELVFGSASIWDVAGIEVFRGPQTSSQGANSIAGAVTVKTKDPTFHREGSAQLQFGSNDMKRASVALSGPLVDDELAARLAVDYHTRDTFIDYVNPNFAKGPSNQDFKSVNARLKLLWAPRDVRGLEAKLTVTHNEGNRPTSEAASTPYHRDESRTASMPSFKQRANTVIGDVAYDFGNGVRLFNRTEATDLSVRRVTSPRTNGGADIDQKSASNETRLSFGDEASTLSGVAGLFYNHARSDDLLYIRGTSDFDDEKQNLGLYTELTYRLSDRWRLTGGLRYQRDRIQRSGTTPYSPVPLDFDETFDAVLPKLSLAYDVTPEVTVGALVNKGYNPGGVGLSFAQARFYDFSEESVWNYELFGRASLLGGRMTLTSNLFYSDFRDSQRLLPDYLNGVLYGAVVVNADKATSYGLEFSLDYQALDNLRLRGGLGLLHTKIDKFANDGALLEGKSFGRAPDYTLSLGADWNVSSRLTLSADLRHTDSYYSTDENLPAYRVSAYTVANARLSYMASGNVELFAYANNLFDKRAPSWKYDDRTAGGIAASMVQPRELGIGVKTYF